MLLRELRSLPLLWGGINCASSRALHRWLIIERRAGTLACRFTPKRTRKRL